MTCSVHLAKFVLDEEASWVEETQPADWYVFSGTDAGVVRRAHWRDVASCFGIRMLSRHWGECSDETVSRLMCETSRTDPFWGAALSWCCGVATYPAIARALAEARLARPLRTPPGHGYGW